jgi:hypothetical protein
MNFECQARWRLLTRRDFGKAFTSWSERNVRFGGDGEQSAAGSVNATSTQTTASVRRISEHISRGIEFEHGTERKTPRGNVYRPYRLTIDETIASVIVLRASEAFRVCEIDVFLTTELPGFAHGETTRAALLFALSDAVRNGGSMALQFTPACAGGAVPPSVTALARTLGIPLGAASHGTIAPEEARPMYLRLTGLGTKARERAQDLSRRGFFSPERIAFLVATGVWPSAEAEMLLLACPYPELLLGTGIRAESRHLHALALAHGRSAVLGGIVARALRYQGSHSNDGVKIDTANNATNGKTFAIDARPVFFEIPNEPAPDVMGYLHGPLSQDRKWEWWSSHPSTITMHRAGQRILVLPRPRGAEETRLFLAQDVAAAERAGSAANARAVLVYPSEFLELGEIERGEAVRAAAARSVDILACPESLAALDVETERRLREGRKLRP